MSLSGEPNRTDALHMSDITPSRTWVIAMQESIEQFLSLVIHDPQASPISYLLALQIYNQVRIENAHSMDAVAAVGVLRAWACDPKPLPPMRWCEKNGLIRVVPNMFVDPMTSARYCDPVVASDGHTYSERWLRAGNTETVGMKETERVVTNRAMVAAMEDPMADEWKRCPITKQVMKLPTISVDDGVTYEQEAILTWLETNDTSPMTREPLTKPIELRPNHWLRHVIRGHRGIDVGVTTAGARP